MKGNSSELTHLRPPLLFSMVDGEGAGLYFYRCLFRSTFLLCHNGRNVGVGSRRCVLEISEGGVGAMSGIILTLNVIYENFLVPNELR